MKPERHIWDEGSTHRSVAGKEYDEIWDYAEQLEEENEALKGNDDGTEKCMNCGSMVEQVWHADDDMWNKLSGYPDGNGLLCTRCFDRAAREQSVYLYWACQPDSFPIYADVPESK